MSEFPTGARREWILAVPCHTLSNPHAISPLALAGVNVNGIDRDAAFAGWMNNADVETLALMDDYTHGLVQFWRFTDRPSAAYPPIANEPPGTSELPYIVLPHSNTCAFRLATATVETDADTLVFLFVADFGGHLYMYDVTDLPDQPRSNWTASHPPVVWTAPPSHYEPGLHSNVRSIDVDVVDDMNIDAYVGVPGYGIAIVRFQRTPGTQTWTIPSSPAVQRIETSSSVYGLRIRNESGLQKLLLVSDGQAGFRIYGRNDL